MKKRLTIITLLVAVTLLLSACSGMVSTSLTAYWNTNQVAYDSDFYEKTTYKVTYDAEDATNTVYDLKNFEGEYVVEVQAGQSGTLADGTTSSALYKLTSTFTLSGTYALKDGKDIFSFDDYSIVSEVIFHRLGEGYNMQPVSSKTTYNIYAPGISSMNSASISACRYVVEISYNASCSKANVLKTDLWTEESENAFKATLNDDNKDVVFIEKAIKVDKSVSKLQKNYSFFDNNQLYFVARGMTFEDGDSYSISTILGNASNKATVALTCDAVSTRKYNFAENDATASEKSISSAEVSIGVNAGNTSGGKITAYFAAKASDKCRLLEIREPLSYGLGQMVYRITSVQTTKNV